MIRVDEDLVRRIAKGAEVLGSGGGGQAYVSELMALQLLKEGRTTYLIDPEEVPDDALILSVALMGSPLILKEKLPNGKEAITVLRMLENYFGEETYAIVPVEGAGLNSLTPIVAGLNSDIPIVDADGMGRAFPELQMTTFHLHGISITPMAISDEKGNTIFVDSIDSVYGEWFARGITRLMGGYSWISFYAMTGRELKKSAIRHTITKSVMIGEILMSDMSNESKIMEICEITGGSLLGEGKVAGISRMRFNRFYGGQVEVVGDKKISLIFQNEYLVAENGVERVTVPDIITLMDVDSLRPITTEEIRCGMNVYVVTMPSDEKWKTEKGLQVVGPEVFGLEE
ncbi:hypothetical protein Asulf_02042 [Archaeoglobus sulfaticallidus PM70-1]|uniref:DUF917 domain-containing protein n=1 Tax=Archaeoglobus sulfaticallidus PM70-1 TaxID=387631 RepID=N0BNV7_9EURY|nr:DUF917 domain-containing protein [Archaeoglobus sulfaticallidus]AGK62005.1 hypothetical protein Asulf_02042 [Archaeoglobus sulfaticallidus PM70-1]